MTPEQIEEARQRALTGQVAKDEMKEIIEHLRKGRVSAGYASKKAKEKKKSEKMADLKVMDGDDDPFNGI